MVASEESFRFLVEGNRLELKEILPEDDKLEKTVIAFCNGAGGEIILGISDNPREVKGVDESEIFYWKNGSQTGYLTLVNR